jgi:hypothetical protein
MTSPPFDRSVFVNCPFDDAYAPLLQAIAFCIIDLGFFPRFADENADNAASRLDRIIDVIRGSKHGIHDLSRCKATIAGEYARMNMPFELGLDHGCARFGGGKFSAKTILILEAAHLDYHKSLSDISGWDIHAHKGDHIRAVQIVSIWLARVAGAVRIGPAKILSNYAAFLKWHWDRETALGASEADIKAYPTFHLIGAMHDWVAAGRPV